MALCVVVCYAQIADIIPSSVSIANTGTAYTARWTAFQNPATLVQEEQWQADLQYENKFLSKVLHTASVQAANCNKYVNVGAGYTFFGYAGWNEMLATVVLSRSFGRFSLGVAADFIAIYAGNESGYRCTAVPQLGMTVLLTRKLTLGFQMMNPFLQSLKLEDDIKRELPSIYSLGLDWAFIEKMRLAVQVDYDVNDTFRAAIGYEWQPLTEFGIKAGCSYRKYFIPAFGVDLRFSYFTFDITAEWHPVLGVNLYGRIGFSK